MSRGPSLWQVTRHPFTAVVYALILVLGVAVVVMFWAVILGAAAVLVAGYGAFRLFTRSRRR